MFIEAHCSVPGCRLPMVMPGAVVISPPVDNESGDMIVTKYHICALCWATKFKKMFGDEFQNDVAEWPHLRNVEFFPVGKPRVTFAKDPQIASIPADLDVPRALAKALWNKVHEDMSKYFESIIADERRAYEEEEKIARFWDEHAQFWINRKRQHPIWDLIKRGWL